MSKLLPEKKHKENFTQPELIKENKKKHNKNIHFTDKLLFDKKLKEFITSYYSNKKSVAVVTDFDYTITSRIDYKTGKEYKSSYYLYDEDIIGGDQKAFNEKRKALADKYSFNVFLFIIKFFFITKYSSISIIKIQSYLFFLSIFPSIFLCSSMVKLFNR